MENQEHFQYYTLWYKKAMQNIIYFCFEIGIDLHRILILSLLMTLKQLSR